MTRGGVLAAAICLVGLALGAKMTATPVHARHTAPVVTDRGAQLYRVTCLSCHGPRGDGHSLYPVPGMAAPALSHLDPRRWTKARIIEVLRAGSPPMPAFGSVLSGADIVRLARYVRAMERH